MRSEEQFDLFWDLVILKQKNLSCPVEESSLVDLMMAYLLVPFHQHPRHTLSRYTCTLKHFVLIVNCIQDRFHQPVYRIYQSLETLLTKACKQEELEEDVDFVCAFYRDEFDKELLRTQFQTLKTHFMEQPSTQISIFDLKHYFYSFPWTILSTFTS